MLAARFQAHLAVGRGLGYHLETESIVEPSGRIVRSDRQLNRLPRLRRLFHYRPKDSLADSPTAHRGDDGNVDDSEVLVSIENDLANPFSVKLNDEPYRSREVAPVMPFPRPPLKVEQRLSLSFGKPREHRSADGGGERPQEWLVRRFRLTEAQAHARSTSRKNT